MKEVSNLFRAKPGEKWNEDSTDRAAEYADFASKQSSFPLRGNIFSMAEKSISEMLNAGSFTQYDTVVKWGLLAGKAFDAPKKYSIRQVCILCVCMYLSFRA